MPRSIGSVFIVFAAIVAGAAIGTLTTSRVYWGYWLRVPSADWLTADVVSVDRFTSFRCCDLPSESGRGALRASAAAQMEGAGDLPLANLPSVLMRKGLLPSNDDAVAVAVLSSVREALNARGLLVEGVQPEYQNAKTLWGLIGVGRDRRGGEVVLAAVWSGEVSNDHHAYYEARLSRIAGGSLILEGVRQYWWDFAGLEGMAHWLGGLAGAITGGLGALVLLLTRTADRRGLRNAVDSPS